MLRFVLLISALFMLFASQQEAYAELTPSLPADAAAYAKTPLSIVGSGKYRKLGFSVYRATLWAPRGAWSPNKPYALQLRYMRSLSKNTLIGAVTDNIREQRTADSETIKRWEKMLQEILPAVAEGDELVGVRVPGGQSVLYMNGKEIARISEPQFSEAFFDIWLGEKADEKLQSELLGKG